MIFERALSARRRAASARQPGRPAAYSDGPPKLARGRHLANVTSRKTPVSGLHRAAGLRRRINIRRTRHGAGGRTTGERRTGRGEREV